MSDSYRFDRHKIVVFWSRKAANTSLNRWLVDGFFHEPCADAGAAREFLLPLKAEPGEALRLVRAEGYRDFILARNPYRRAVSAFVEKFCFLGDKRLLALADLEHFAQVLIREAVGDTGSYRGITFVEFLRHIVERVRNPGKRGEPRLNGHFAPQVPLLFQREGFHYGNIIHLEALPDGLAPLAEALGISLPFPHARRNNPAGVRRVADGDLSTVPSAELAANGILPEFEALFSEEARELATEAFAADLHLLGYAPQAASRSSSAPSATWSPGA